MLRNFFIGLVFGLILLAGCSPSGKVLQTLQTTDSTSHTERMVPDTLLVYLPGDTVTFFVANPCDSTLDSLIVSHGRIVAELARTKKGITGKAYTVADTFKQAYFRKVEENNHLRTQIKETVCPPCPECKTPKVIAILAWLGGIFLLLIIVAIVVKLVKL